MQMVTGNSVIGTLIELMFILAGQLCFQYVKYTEYSSMCIFANDHLKQ